MSEATQPCGASDPAESPGREPVVPPEARQEIEAVLSAFRQWLLEAAQWRRALVLPEEQTDAEATVDLHTLLAEWIALKQEVRLEARVGKTTRQELDRAIGEFQQGVDKVQQQAQGWLDPLVRDRDRLRDDLADQRESQQRSWVELLLDVRDALARGAAAAAQADRRLGWRRWFLPRRLFAGLHEGYALALRRIDAALEAREIRRIECLGHRVDPERMRVVDLVQRDDVPQGQVIEVVREGYVCGARVIRYAEVRAAARAAPTDEA